MKNGRLLDWCLAASLGLCGTAQAASWLACANPPVDPAAVEAGGIAALATSTTRKSLPRWSLMAELMFRPACLHLWIE